jgi:hypothetical protein
MLLTMKMLVDKIVLVAFLFFVVYLLFNKPAPIMKSYPVESTARGVGILNIPNGSENTFVGVGTLNIPNGSENTFGWWIDKKGKVVFAPCIMCRDK